MFYHKRDFTPHTNVTEFILLKDMKVGQVFPMMSESWVLQEITQPVKNKNNGDSAPRYKFRNADMTKSAVMHISHGEVHVNTFEWATTDANSFLEAPADFGLIKRESFYGRDFTKSVTKGVITGKPYQEGDAFEIRVSSGGSRKQVRTGFVKMVTPRFMLIVDMDGEPMLFRKGDVSTMNRHGIAFLDETKYDYQLTTPGYLAIY